MDILKNLGVQSYCFREFKDNATVAKMVRELGLSNIELCGVHANFNDPSTWDEVIETYRSAGVNIVAIGVNHFGDNEAELRNNCEFAKKAGAKFISIHFDLKTIPGCFELATKLSKEYGIGFGIHNHGGRHWLGPSEMYLHIASGTDGVGVWLDTAWCLDSGENPVKVAEKAGKKLFGTHIKDFVFDRARNFEDVVIGSGNLDLPAFIKTLEAIGFDGPAIIEYEGDANNPVPALAKCVEAVKGAIA